MKCDIRYWIICGILFASDNICYASMVYHIFCVVISSSN